MKDLLTRRNILIGAGGAVVAAGGAFEAARLLRPAPSPYDDLFARLEDRNNGVEIGKAVLAETAEFDAKSVAAKLRTTFQHATLSQTATADEAAGRLLEAHGWVLPESVALLCALAAKAAV